MDAAKGAVARLAMSHTASRVLQAAAKHAPPPARAAAVAEVRVEAIPLAKSSYGHFLVVKLIANAPKEEVAGALVCEGAAITVLRFFPFPFFFCTRPVMLFFSTNITALSFLRVRTGGAYAPLGVADSIHVVRPGATLPMF